MKSLVQEASTIAKAIEQAWKEAGEPQEFSVKVLELPQRNFLGLTSRSAKIAFLFNEYKKPTQEQRTGNRSYQKTVPSQKREEYAPRGEKKQNKQQEITRPQKNEKPEPPQVKKTKRESLWSDDLVAHAKTWLSQTLVHMGYKDVTFSVEPQNFYLRITLNKKLMDDETKEKHMLASLSLLMLAAVKKQFRKGLRGHKIVLTHE